ncbi:hypothetical protein GE21DRAFT_2407 [Neurospora crassa]|uniref:Uncharacterized protein n=1 Tax=Neurospora crassa (strain ATCC 24698 / 74-OR23-1A / CBS 708.71 / DSM 1257 / FGSC 987) TaxID=367110 RepID=Q7SHL5_NEUCR|nr:hypothetical protein NCU02889 [Neurospora crassa OR74A]EAA36335.1 hypothetical protein NCU02889 [Neurospora crassa OR74A]KHE89343.1 hypothetical protein GE21DRAFT_2407 [Neurospora crassa]|eukprot:XP_965571.1 hypothetical protein NCU02889 [Neurospora crassa OR74A]
MAEMVDPNAPPAARDGYDSDGDYDMGYNDDDFDAWFQAGNFEGASNQSSSPGNHIQQCANLARQILSRSPPPAEPVPHTPYESAVDMEEAPPPSAPIYKPGVPPIPPRPSPTFRLPSIDTVYDGLLAPSSPAREQACLPAQGPAPPPIAPPVPHHEDDVLEVIDPNGNIIVGSGGPQRQRFLASTAAILRSSPVLAAIIMPERHSQVNQQPPPPPTPSPLRSPAAFVIPPEQDRSSLPTLFIPDVEDRVCKTFLLVIHGFLNRVEKSFKSVQLFYDLLMFTHRYGMTLSLQSVAVPWLKRIYHENPLRHDEVAKQLWIVYELGHLKMIRHTIRCMVKTARINKDGQLLGYGAQEGKDEYTQWAPLVHLGLLRDITICRQRVINRLLFEVEQVIERLTSSPPVLPPRDPSDDEEVQNYRARSHDPRNPRQPIEIPSDDTPRQLCVSRRPPGRVTHAVNCDASMLGALQRVLRQEGWATMDLTCSPSHLYRRIKKIGKTATEQVVITHTLKGHRACDPFGDDKWIRLDELIMREVKMIPFDVEELKKRGGMMGFSIQDWK